jgi:hypothetical protein
MVTRNISEYRYLIIGGTTKAATTSLFNYLADHPQVCESTRKETRFFTDASAPGRVLHRHEEGLDKYMNFFAQCPPEKLRVEATPEYLYSPNTAEKIKDSLPNARMLFILREPVSRLVSCYGFAKQKGEISETVTFDQYLEGQLDERSIKEENWRPLKQGHYSYYLRSYFDVLGRDRVYVVFYEELSRVPKSVLREICGFAGIDFDFYEDYDLRVFNPTVAVRNSRLHQLFISWRFRINRYTYRVRGLNTAILRIGRHVKPIYLRLNTRQTEEVAISPSRRAFLYDYYSKDADALARLIGRAVPWKSAGAYVDET